MTYEVRVYKIYWMDSNDIFIGSTRQNLSSTITKHRWRSKQCQNFKRNSNLHLKMKDNMDFEYILLESGKVSSTDEKRQLEKKYILDLKPKLNIIRSTPIVSRDNGKVKKKNYIIKIKD